MKKQRKQKFISHVATARIFSRYGVRDATRDEAIADLVKPAGAVRKVDLVNLHRIADAVEQLAKSMERIAEQQTAWMAINHAHRSADANAGQGS